MGEKILVLPLFVTKYFKASVHKTGLSILCTAAIADIFASMDI
jgi:hypothetical protein